MSIATVSSQSQSVPVVHGVGSTQEQRLSFLLSVLFFAGLCRLLWQPFLAHTSWLILLQDDCFYYLQVARNIASGHGSTFNGLTLTNGYQPLWLWILAGVCLVTTRPLFLLVFIAGTILSSSVATFLLIAKLLRST